MDEAYVVLCAIGNGPLPIAPALYSFPYATKKAAMEAMKWFKAQGAECKMVADVSNDE